MNTNAKLLELAERRAMLVSRAAAQRKELAQALTPWHGPLAVVDRGVSVFRYLRQHPALLAGAMVGVAVLRPKRVFSLVRSGWVAWRMAMAVKRKLS